jgi:hypothetical protein
MWAVINKFFRQGAAFQWQLMIDAFIGDAEIGAGLLPFDAVWLNAPPPTAFIGDQMSELMAQRAPFLFGIDFFNLWIELDQTIRPPCPPCGCLHA